MSLSSLGFGILLILQAAFAQSAPYLSSYTDEEAILDKLASIASAARSGSNSFDLQFPSSSLDYSDVLSVGNIGKNSPVTGLENLGSRQFAYKPDDIRFYFPTAAQFPSNTNTNNNNNNNNNPSLASSNSLESNNNIHKNIHRFQQQQQIQSDDEEPIRYGDRERDSREDLFNVMAPNSQFSPQDIVDGLRKQQQRELEQAQEQQQRQQQLLMEDEQREIHSFNPMKKSQPEAIEYGGGPYFQVMGRSNSESPGDSAGGAGSNSNSDSNVDSTENQNSQTELDHNNPQIHSHIMASSHDAHSPNVISSPLGKTSSDTWQISSFYYIAVIAGCTAAIVVGVIAAGICWYRIHERVKAAADVDYPAYGVTGPSKDVSPSGGDRKLAQSAHFYNYQHQKQQIQGMQGSKVGDRAGGSAGCSDVESEASDNEDGDYTVYECPGLAGLGGTGEMEVKNPLYDDEPTPATPHVGAPSPNIEVEPQEPSSK